MRGAALSGAEMPALLDITVLGQWRDACGLSVQLLSTLQNDLSAIIVLFHFSPNLRGLLSYSRVSRSALRHLATATMALADFWRSFPTPLDVGSTKAERQISPGITHSPSRLCLSDLGRSVPCKNWASQGFACSPRYPASIRFLFVRPALCPQLPPDPTSRRAPLPLS